jgi:hypothetical protein
VAVMLDRYIDRTPALSDDPDEARRLTGCPCPGTPDTSVPDERAPLGVAAAFGRTSKD